MRGRLGTSARKSEILDRGDLEAWERVERNILAILVALFDASALEYEEPLASIGLEAPYAIEARRCIHTEGFEALDIDAVSVEVGIGRHDLNRCFRRHCGVGTREFVHCRRLHLARDLLMQPTAALRVIEAAYRFGFSHLGRFAQQYKRLFGESPSRTLPEAVREASRPIHRAAGAVTTSERLHDRLWASPDRDCATESLPDRIS